MAADRAVPPRSQSCCEHCHDELRAQDLYRRCFLCGSLLYPETRVPADAAEHSVDGSEHEAA